MQFEVNDNYGQHIDHRTERDEVFAGLALQPLGLHKDKELFLRTLSSNLRQKSCPVTTSDFECLNTLAKNPAEHGYVRAVAAFLIGMGLCNPIGPSDERKIFKQMQKALALFESLTPTESSDTCWFFDPDEPMQMDLKTAQNCIAKDSVSGWMSPLWKYVSIGLGRERGRDWSLDEIRALYNDRCKVNPDSKYPGRDHACLGTMCFKRDPVSASLSCKTCAAVYPAVLKPCGGCQRVWYCSTVCQKKDWKAEHKQFCRAPDVLRKGDIVKLAKLVEQMELNNQFRELGEFNVKKGRWAVTWFGGSNEILVKPENLIRILTSEEKEYLLNQEDA
ncbi:hypothetical protein HDU98_009814 [Podochytrium sp. JEL0797]|nr:hypothetical protein HDU98_009814 [Podochytrium sp. JEL0797]